MAVGVALAALGAHLGLGWFVPPPLSYHPTLHLPTPQPLVDMHKKMLMEQCKNDRAISMTVSIESMRYLSLKLSKTDEAAATDEKGKSKDKKKGKDDKKKDDKKKDDKKKGKDDKKKGKDKGKPDDDKKEDEDEDEEGGKPFLKRGIRLAFTLPGEVVSKDAKEASHTSKPYARKALVRYDYAKLVKLPISVALRDFFKFDGLVIDAFEDVNSPPKKKRDAGDGAEADAGGGGGGIGATYRHVGFQGGLGGQAGGDGGGSG